MKKGRLMEMQQMQCSNINLHAIVFKAIPT